MKGKNIKSIKGNLITTVTLSIFQVVKKGIIPVIAISAIMIPTMSTINSRDIYNDKQHLVNRINIYDTAGLLTTGENSKIDRLSKEVSDIIGADIIVMTTSDTGYEDLALFIKDFKREMDISEDSIILVVDLELDTFLIKGFGEGESIKLKSVYPKMKDFYDNQEYYKMVESYINNISIIN